jgi:hypothetical protein
MCPTGVIAMITAPMEIEGTAEEIAAEIERWPGRRMRLTILPKCDVAETVQTVRPIQEALAEIAASAPPDEQAKVPADFSSQLDHYIYGSPKR